MYPVFVIVLGLAIAGYSDQLSRQYSDLGESYTQALRQQQLMGVSAGVQQYITENTTPPVSLAALVGSAGFEHIRTQLENRQAYVVSPNLVDSSWQFNRVVLASVNPANGQTASSFLAQNTCGSGDVNTANSWCGDKTKGLWFRFETREDFNNQLSMQRYRLSQLLQKFAVYFNDTGYFPNKDYSGNTLSTSSVVKLVSLVNYTGNNKNCSGQFSYQGIPIDCQDLYGVWGQEISYQYVSDTKIVLTTESGMVTASGENFSILSQYDLSGG